MGPFQRLNTMPSLPPASAELLAAAAAEADARLPLQGRDALPVRFVGRRPRTGHVPLVLHFHGGAFVAGDLEAGSTIARLIAKAGAVVVSLDYPLAPAHPFPQAVEAGYDALVWAYKHRARLAGEGAPVFLAGEEAGGNLAAAVTLMARDRGHPPLAGQILLSPMLDPCLATASLRKAEAGRSGCKWADGWHDYLPKPCDASHPYAAPGPSMRLAGLPATLLVSARDDPLRDETHAYARRLRATGVGVDEAVLPLDTGWPDSYLDPQSIDAPWAPVVQEHLQQYFARCRDVTASAARPSSSSNTETTDPSPPGESP